MITAYLGVSFMVEYDRHIIDVDYHGKHYTHITSLAKAAGISAQKINQRWSDGIRDVNKLVYRGELPIEFHGSIEITYNGKYFESLKEFARANGLVYNRLRSLYRRGIHDPEILIEKAQRKEVPEILKRVVKDDYQSNEKDLKSNGLLSLRQVSEITGVSKDALTELTARIERGQHNNSGLQKDDIVHVDRENAHDKQVNTFTMQKRAFRPSAVTHLLVKQKDKQALEPIPFYNSNYFYDDKEKTVYGYRKKSNALKLLKEHPKDIYTLRDNNGKRYTFTIADIEDMIANPDILADDLITKAEIINELGGTKSMWDNRGIVKCLNRNNSHSRYNSQSKKVTGWLPKTVEIAKKEHPELFVPNHKNK